MDALQPKKISIQGSLSGYFFTPRFCLVPTAFFSEDKAGEMLSDVVSLEAGSTIGYAAMPRLGAYLVYSPALEGDERPDVYYMLQDLFEIREYNKIMASWQDGWLCLAIAQGKSLLLTNSYKAADFTTAEYFIFLALKKLQLNPEISSITFRTPLSGEQEMSLYRYFKAVDTI